MLQLLARITRLSPIVALVAVAVLESSGMRADEPKAPAPRGQIAIYAQFEAPDQPHGQEWGLFSVDLATNAWTKLVAIPMNNGVPELYAFRISPDRRRMAYNDFQVRQRHARAASVWVREIHDGAVARRISPIGGRPIWAPDGRHLLVVEVMGDGPALQVQPRFATWKIDDNGSHAVRLPVPETDEVVDWSPDGKWLVGFARRAVEGNDPVYENVVMHPDGTERRPLPGPGVGLFPRFSPDSRRIAYVTRGKDPADMLGKSLWVVGVDGKDRRMIFREPRSANLANVAVWSPDGKYLAINRLTWTTIDNGVVTPRDPRLCVIDVETREVHMVPQRRATVLGSPEWR